MINQDLNITMSLIIAQGCWDHNVEYMKNKPINISEHLECFLSLVSFCNIYLMFV